MSGDKKKQTRGERGEGKVKTIGWILEFQKNTKKEGFLKTWLY